MPKAFKRDFKKMFRIRINIDYNIQDRVYIKTNYTTCSSQQHILIKVNDLDLQDDVENNMLS